MIDEARPKTPIEALRRFFGYQEFRPGQEEIIRSALARRDTMVVMPTGGGKSLCYQIPALLLDGITVVVSPLIALMKDQVDALARCGVRATTINSTLDFSTVRQRMTDIRYGLYRMLYVAPERFESTSFLELMHEVRISLFAVDEAHCISEWGHDFRPSYLKLREAAAELGRPPIIALTATATPFVQEDIIRQLDLQEPKRFVRGFDRPNLSYNARLSADKDNDLRELMKGEMGREGSVVIYCGTRRNVESAGTMLHAERLPVTIYHAGMRDLDRRTAQEMFIAGKVKAIIATNAFGMGIDKSDVRHVIHVDMPGSIEAYYQEAGRAGRDGQPSDCTLLHTPRDRRLQEFFIRSSFPEREELELLYESLWDSLHIGVGNRFEGVFVPDMRQMASRSRIHPAALGSVLAVLEKNGVIRKLKSERLGMVRFLASSAELQEYYQRTRDMQRQKTIMALLRTLGGAALGQQTMFNPDDVASKYGMTPDVFERNMRSLMMGGLLVYTPPTPGAGYQFLHERMSPRKLALDERAIQQGRDRALQKLDAMERYIRSTSCRRDFILEYFCAEPEPAPCGHCDICRTPRLPDAAGSAAGISARDAVLRLPRPQTTRAIEQLLASVEEFGGRFGRMTVVDALRGARNATIERFGLDRHHRFGELREIDRGELARIADALIEDGLMETSASLRPTIRLTARGRHAIRHLTLRPFSPEWEDPDSSRNPDLLRELRSTRDRIAVRDSMAAPAVCADEILVRLSNEFPSSRHAFMAIEGMTTDIYERCGAPFLALIEAATRQDERAERPDIPERLRRTLSLLMEGSSLQEIAHRSALQPSTISVHIEELLKLGTKIPIERFVPAGIIRAVRDQLVAMPTASLRELRALLGGAVDYPELRIASAWIRWGGDTMTGVPAPANGSQAALASSEGIPRNQ